jgi:hypothetical protein
MLSLHFKMTQMRFILFFCLFLFAQCSNTEEFEPPFDISIIQMIPDQEKQFIDREFIGDSFYCYMQRINYFQDGYELLLKLSISSKLDGKLYVPRSFFNHLISPALYFYSVKNGVVDVRCENEYLNYTNVCENIHHLDLKAGEHYFVLRFKFDDCEFRNGYLSIKSPFQNNTDLELLDRFNYINGWLLNGLYFRVIDGKVSNSPIHYLPHVYPKEVDDYIKSNYY